MLNRSEAYSPRVARRRALCAASSALAALVAAAPALAQTAPATPGTQSATNPALPATTQSQDPAAPPALVSPTPNEAASTTGPKEIVVTGTHITSAGFTAPTPTQILGEQEIARNAEPNVFTTIAQLPSLQGSTGATTGTFSTSSGQQGLSSFSLRGLGTIRTLTLLDGQRVVGANVTGVPDISEFPQLLIKRVDVVTGGASASYGSDAVGGVVNFITDKHFEGFKANVEGGITTYGDDGQYLLQAAVGHAFLDGHLHVEASGEYDHENGVGPGNFGEDLAGSRHWYNTATFVNTGITNNGSPQYLVRQHAQAYQYTKYGLISAGPLQGIAFDQNGHPFQFNYGSNGTPAKDAKGNVNGCYIGFCLGGDLSGNVGSGASLQSALERKVGYGRIGYDLDDRNEIYATLNLANVKTSNQPNPGAAETGLTLSCGNPYLPASVAAQCAAAGITSFPFGTSDAILPNIKVHTDRTQYRGVLGADGRAKLLGTDWTYDAYYEHGENITDINVDHILLTPRYKQAIQATTINGAIVCADPTARASGCQPIDVFGGATPSQAALAYIEPAVGPFQHTRQTEDVASFSFSGEPATLWAGPLSLAAGVEYRREFYHVLADPYGNGVTTESPYSATYPADPILSTAGTNWYAGNYHDGRGTYHVWESFAELNLPVLDSAALGKANLNVAGRWTHYSTSGTVYTWKVGGTWNTPLDGIRLRAVTSRDVRAPNLSELFAAPIATTIPNFTNPFNNSSLLVIQSTIGNTQLKPEIARNTEAGIVLSNPSWARGFSASIDYYRIRLDGVISTLSAQQEVNLCFAGSTDLCGTFNFAPASGLPYVNVQAFNLASIFTDGFDIEASYQTQLGRLGLPGRLILRGLATNVRRFITDSGVPGTIPVDSAGVNSGNTPRWKLLAIETWSNERASLTLQQRWFSTGTYGNQYVVCQAGSCPLSTVNNPTIDNNTMPGAFYLDLGGSFNITRKLTAYFKVDNLLNQDPAASPQTNTGLDVNPALYDTLGRFYHFGVRYNF